jgi:hypothetical protein
MHYDAVASCAASGIMSASLKSNTPCIFGCISQPISDEHGACFVTWKSVGICALAGILVMIVFQESHE